MNNQITVDPHPDIIKLARPQQVAAVWLNRAKFIKDPLSTLVVIPLNTALDIPREVRAMADSRAHTSR